MSEFEPSQGDQLEEQIPVEDVQGNEGQLAPEEQVSAEELDRLIGEEILLLQTEGVVAEVEPGKATESAEELAEESSADEEAVVPEANKGKKVESGKGTAWKRFKFGVHALLAGTAISLGMAGTAEGQIYVPRAISANERASIERARYVDTRIKALQAEKARIEVLLRPGSVPYRVEKEQQADQNVKDFRAKLDKLKSLKTDEEILKHYLATEPSHFGKLSNPMIIAKTRYDREVYDFSRGLDFWASQDKALVKMNGSPSNAGSLRYRLNIINSELPVLLSEQAQRGRR